MKKGQGDFSLGRGFSKKAPSQTGQLPKLGLL